MYVIFFSNRTEPNRKNFKPNRTEPMEFSKILNRTEIDSVRFGSVRFQTEPIPSLVHMFFNTVFIGHCIDEKEMSVKCTTDYCAANIISDEDEGLVRDTHCGHRNSLPVPGLLFVLQFNMDFTNIVRMYLFRCEYDNCNNVSILQLVLNNFHEQYDILSILTVFGYEQKGTEQETTNTLTKSPSITQQTNSVTPNPTTSSTISCTSTSSTISSTSTSSLMSSTSTSSSVSSSISTTITTAPADTTNKSNYALPHQSFDKIIYMTLIITTSYWHLLA